MTGNGAQLNASQRLDVWLTQHDAALFPSFDSSNGQMSYPDRYANFSAALCSIHNNVEKGAMVSGALQWMEESRRISAENDANKRAILLKELQEADPIVHLNNHGRGHVDKVIQKVSELIHFFDRGHLTPYEGFFLLCAIQLHDVGNVYGRKEHERQAARILEEKGKPFIPDAIERKVIEKVALVHGGACDGDRDTIRHLSSKKKLYDREIRKSLLAALLRFGDELADDHSRADHEGLEHNTIIPGGVIYHRYSQALHTVKIERNPETDAVELYLCYEFDSSIAAQQYNKANKNVYLLDEIYDRTLKMERERRYCMRYLRPCLSLDRIKVEIIIQDFHNPFNNDRLTYTLEENGYPSTPSSGGIKKFGSELRTGEEELLHMIDKHWEIDL